MSEPLPTQPSAFHVELPQRQQVSVPRLASLLILLAAWGAFLTSVAVTLVRNHHLFSAHGALVLVAVLPALSCLHVIGATIAAPDKRLTQRSMSLLALAHLPMSFVFWAIVAERFG